MASGPLGDDYDQQNYCSIGAGLVIGSSKTWTVIPRAVMALPWRNTCGPRLDNEKMTIVAVL